MSSAWLIPKLVFALFVGGIVAAALFAAATVLATYAEPPLRLMTENFWLYLPLFAPALVVIALGIGVPSFFILRHLRYLNWISVLIVGACVGLVGAMLLFASGQGFGATLTIDRALMCIVIGMVGALCAFIVLLRSNVLLNRDAPQTTRSLA